MKRRIDFRMMFSLAMLFLLIAVAHPVTASTDNLDGAGVLLAKLSTDALVVPADKVILPSFEVASISTTSYLEVAGVQSGDQILHQGDAFAVANDCAQGSQTIVEQKYLAAQAETGRQQLMFPTTIALSDTISAGTIPEPLKV